VKNNIQSDTSRLGLQIFSLALFSIFLLILK